MTGLIAAAPCDPVLFMRAAKIEWIYTQGHAGNPDKESQSARGQPRSEIDQHRSRLALNGLLAEAPPGRSLPASPDLTNHRTPRPMAWRVG
jgi:hypothetical protein